MVLSQVQNVLKGENVVSSEEAQSEKTTVLEVEVDGMSLLYMSSMEVYHSKIDLINKHFLHSSVAECVIYIW